MLSKKVFSVFNKINYFFSSPYNERSFLTFFRTAVSLVALIEIASLAIDLHLFFSSSGTLIPQELMYLQTEYFKYLHPLYQFLERNNLTEFFYQASTITYALSLLFLLMGLFTRYAAILALLLQIIIFKSFSNFNYGYDSFLTMSLFYCVVFPVGQYDSLDTRIFKKQNQIIFNYRHVLQVHLAIAYFFSGIAKSLDTGWWNGESVWRAVASVDNDFYSWPPVLFVIVSIGTVLLEISYPFLINIKKTRLFVLTGIILMHVGIAVMMELYAFSAIMIVWNLSAFGNISIKPKPVNEAVTI